MLKSSNHVIFNLFSGIPSFPSKWNIGFHHPIANIFEKGRTVFYDDGLFCDYNPKPSPLKIKSQNKKINCGTVIEPDIEKLLQYSKPSSFGRGEETIYDENVRKGREICANELSSPLTGIYLYYELRKKLFPNPHYNIKFVFNKLAIYEEGGHFDVHRDTIHSDDHQGTLLIEVRSPHTGGDLILQHNGEEFRWSLATNENNNSLKWIAFYTDVQHRVEPVTSGVRMVLQYDIHVSNEIERDRNDENYGETFFGSRPQYPESFSNELPSKLLAALEEFVNDDKSISFPMFHLYCDSQLVPNRLKSNDYQLFTILINAGYCVQLIPVSVHATSDYFEGTYEDEGKYDILPISTTLDSYILEEDKIVEVEMKQFPKNVEYCATGFEQVHELVHFYYAEHAGNEAAPGEYRYFHSVFVVHKKKVLEMKTAEKEEEIKEIEEKEKEII